MTAYVTVSTSRLVGDVLIHNPAIPVQPATVTRAYTVARGTPHARVEVNGYLIATTDANGELHTELSGPTP